MKRLWLLATPLLLLACESPSITRPETLAPDDARRATASAPCTAVCYVNGATGNDVNNGDTPAGAKKTIQAALDQVSAGGQVRVFPGAYDEEATNRAPMSIGGTYTFGLFFTASKPGVTLLGVDAANRPVLTTKAIQATITTRATNNFGPDGIFVDADNTTIQGVRIGGNLGGDNKTIEVVADNFALQASETTVPNGGGSVYIDDVTPAGARVKRYRILLNNFPDGTSVDLSSGAGLTGPVVGRVIAGNKFDLVGSPFNAISFNGSETGVPWFVNSVGGAIILANSFKGGTTQYVRARGTYDNSQFDWKSYFYLNTYDSAAIVLVSKQPFVVRSYEYFSGPYDFKNVRRIGVTAAGESAHALPGDMVITRTASNPAIDH